MERGVERGAKGLDWADYWECMISALLSTAFAGLTKPLLLVIQAFKREVARRGTMQPCARLQLEGG